jgi:hypothetical protein
MISFGNVPLRGLGAWLLGACLLMPGRLCRAQDIVVPDPAVSSKTANDTHTLTGTVVNSVTGEPVRRAAVQITSPQISSVVLTDYAGHFLVEGLPEGLVSVSVMKPGYNGPGGREATVAEVSRDTAPLVLKMAPDGVIFGQVTTRDGRPLEGFFVGLISKQTTEGRATWVEPPIQTPTNEDGEFRIAGLPAGTYYIAVNQSSVTTPAQQGVPNSREQVYAKVLYPGVSDFSAATPLEVTPGREVEANFSLTAEPVYAVSGEASAHGSVVSNMTVVRKAGQGEDFTLPVNVQDGKFQTKLPAGTYRVTAAIADGPQIPTGTGSIVVSGDSADVQIPLVATNIPVEVRTEHGEAENAIPALMVQLNSTSPPFRFARWWRGQSGGIDNVEPGEYAAQIQASGDLWVKSATCGGVDLLSDDLTVVDGSQTPPIEITLQHGAGGVSGKVDGANPWSPATVLLVQTHGKKNNVKITPVVSGMYGFPGVAPGDYLVLAIDHADQLEYANPDVLSSYLASAERVTVSSGQTATVNLNVASVKR